jgi:hypothetical protein
MKAPGRLERVNRYLVFVLKQFNSTLLWLPSEEIPAVSTNSLRLCVGEWWKSKQRVRRRRPRKRLRYKPQREEDGSNR